MGRFVPVGALLIVVLTAINIIGLSAGKMTQNLLTIVECAGLVLVIVAGLFFAHPEPGAAGPVSAQGAFGLAMVFVLLTYGGWNDAAYLSAEIREIGRASCRERV